MINKENLMELIKIRHSGYSHYQNKSIVYQKDINIPIEKPCTAPYLPHLMMTRVFEICNMQ
ncbi:MAG: hypothetical protein ACR5KW_00800 [Wolbachia sp.]